MLRQIAAIFLLLAFSVQIFNRSIILLDYYANTASFAKNCENKARPVMRCNGKCQVMKKLKDEEKKEQQNPERKLDNKNEVLFTASSFATLCFCSVNLHQPFTSFYSSLIPRGIYTDIFHPPTLV